LKIILLVNWGIGLEIIRVLHEMTDVQISFVVTGYSQGDPDIWRNAVHRFACEHAYPVLEQEKLTFSRLGRLILEYDVDLIISHAYMKIFPRKVFSAPRLGSINIHPSLLPKYRGPSPSYWVIKNKEKTTGLTCHYIDDGIDTGDIIYQKSILLSERETVETIIEKQKTIVGDVILESLRRIRDFRFRAIPQASEEATYAPKPN
jgi:methionyl-tRNA formyltransferase